MDNASSLQKQQQLSHYPLSGSCRGRMALVSLDKDFLQPFLPEKLELAPQHYTKHTQHPLLLMFNYTHLHPNVFLAEKVNESGEELELNYNEFILMIPYVQFIDKNHNGDAPYCFLPVLYLDSLLAVIGGRIFWEFNKEMASFTTSETIFNIAHETSGETYFKSNFNDSQTLVPARSEPNFVQIEPILNLPVIEYGPLGYVSSTYVVEYENAWITPSSATVSNNICKYLPPGEINFQPISEGIFGAFYMNYDWKLSFIKYIEF